MLGQLRIVIDLNAPTNPFSTITPSSFVPIALALSLYAPSMVSKSEEISPPLSPITRPSSVVLSFTNRITSIAFRTDSGKSEALPTSSAKVL